MYHLRLIIAALVFFLFSLNAFSQVQNNLSLSQLYKNLRTSVVVLSVLSTTKKEQKNSDGKLSIVAESSVDKGSGFLISDDLILTAAHVVHGSELVQVKFYDGVEIVAKVISSDIYADLSLVKLERKHPSFKPVVLGDSNKVDIGDPVFIIGAPYNISYTLTRGVISGRHQEGYDSEYYKANFFQTDAALNPGNSGGPMFNMKGEAIGVASFIKSESGGSSGLGFVISMNSAKKNMLKQPRFYSGITHYYLKGNLAKALNVPQKAGLLIQSVVKDSMANQIGLNGGSIKISYDGKPVVIGGDIILKINDISLDSLQNFKKIQKNLLKVFDAKSITVTIFRNGKIQELTWIKSNE